MYTSCSSLTVTVAKQPAWYWTYSQKFFCHFRWYRCHLEFCYYSAVLHRLLLNCGSALWLTVCAAGWATPGQSHLSFSEQWMTQQQRHSLDSTLCHLTVGRIGEDGRRWAELRFRASPSHISSTHTIAHVVKRPGCKSLWWRLYIQGIKEEMKDYGTQATALHNVVVVFLMRIKVQITVFINYNERQRIWLVSTNAETYWQLWVWVDSFPLK